MAKALPRGVREKNGSYEARAVVNGIRINLYGTDLNELMEEFERAKENARDTLDYRKTRITLNEWFEEWFSEVKQHRVKETSIAPMKNNFKRTFGFYIGSMKLKDIKPLDVQRALNAMEQNHVSHSAMREALGRLRECLDFALGNQLIKVNPCLIVEVPWTFKQSKEEIALTQEEQDNFLSEMEDSWYKEMFYFMCLTGVRVGELGGMKWSDIDFKNNLINIKRTSLYSKDRGIYQDTPKTEQSKRSISVPAKVMELLRVYKKEYNTKRLALGTAWTDTGFILVQENGKPMHPDTLTDYCSSFRTKYNNIIEKENKDRPKTNKLPLLPHINPHAFRHSQASMLILSGLDCATVSKRLGHANISTTTNIYTHILHEADKKASDKLENILLNQNKQKQVILN